MRACVRAYIVRGRGCARDFFFSVYSPRVLSPGIFTVADRQLYRRGYGFNVPLGLLPSLINPFDADGVARRIAQFMRIHFTAHRIPLFS